MRVKKTPTKLIPQMHPRILRRNMPSTPKYVTRKTELNNPVFKKVNALRVQICNKNSTLIYNWVNKIYNFPINTNLILTLRGFGA